MSDTSTGGGIGFFGLLTIVFVTLKLTHYIDWSWWWVLAPAWGPAVIILVVTGLILMGALVFAATR